MGQKNLESKILEIGAELYHKSQSGQVGFFSTDYWQTKLMDWVMKDPEFKIDMFRFVDVLPVLTNSKLVSQHIKEYLLKENRELPTAISTSLKAATNSLTSGIAAKTIKKQVESLATKFIVGQDANSSIRALKKLRDQNFDFTIDLLGEETLSHEEGDAYLMRYHDLIDGFSANKIKNANLSLKLSAVAPNLKSEDPQASVEYLVKKLLPLYEKACELNYFINIDAEQWRLHEITYLFLDKILEEPSLKNYKQIGIVAQAYLKNSRKDLERLNELAKKNNKKITVRLVKGAYWDYEYVVSKQHGYKCPVFENKFETDLNFEKCSDYLFKNFEFLKPAIASHNLRSISNSIALAESLGVPKDQFEFQTLHGMGEAERKALRDMGYKVRVYCPVGELLPGMAYLVRRLLENTSNEGFLKQKDYSQVDIKDLLKVPNGIPKAESKMTTFQNCAFSDFTLDQPRESFNKALLEVNNSLPLNSPVVLSGHELKNNSDKRYSPNNLDKHIGNVSWADKNLANQAVEEAYESFEAFRNLDLNTRIGFLNKLGDILERDRYYLSALMSVESAKPWAEADGDLAEAVDFCKYYAELASIELSPQKQGDILGEQNKLLFEGRGPTVVIAPWNFPLAILCGMSVAALVAGNTVIMKPAEQSSLIAYKLFKCMLEAGIPKEAVQFLPGNGEEIGPVLVSHPKVAQIVFTGSKSVGHQIYKSAAKVVDNQIQMKRVICEMGGKNAIIIDEDADLDEAVSGVVKAAFGFAGQKCSACSRVLVLDSVYDHFRERLTGAVKSLKVSSAENPNNDLGPVIDRESYDRLSTLISQNSDKILCQAEINLDEASGNYIPPTVFEMSQDSDDLQHDLMLKEHFGPILALKKVKDLDEALSITNNIEFALTAGFFSRSPKNLDYVQKNLRVGNLYLNQACTGALVNRQPFGGFKMSGTGIKAGGPGYLKHFVDERCVTENTMRRGFTPELTN